MADKRKVEPSLSLRIKLRPSQKKPPAFKLTTSQMTPEKVRQILSYTEPILSIDNHVVATRDHSFHIRYLIDILRSEEPSPEDIAIQKNQQEFIFKLIDQLKPTQSAVIKMRLFEEESLENTAVRLYNETDLFRRHPKPVTRERIRQIENKALFNLKKILMKQQFLL